jgi:hyperosmotically inducible protein
MKSANFFTALSGVLALVVACNVYAQANNTIASGAKGSSGTSAKATKEADKQLARNVRAALAKVRGIDVSGVAVHASGGAVILRGSVPDVSQIDKAGNVVTGVPGVTSVTNKLVSAPRQEQGR